MSYIWDSLKTIIDVIKYVFNEIADLISMIGYALGLLGSAIASLPPFVQAFAAITLTVLVLLQLLGRDNGTGGG